MSNVFAYDPDSVSPPGSTVQDTLDSVGMTQRELADRMGRTPKFVNELIQGKAPLTAETALQLERVFGVPARFWAAREQHYRDWLERDKEEQRLEPFLAWAQRFPITQMVANGWIEQRQAGVEQIRELLGFFGIASPDYWEFVDATFRQSRAYTSSPEAISVWLRQGEREAREIACEPYDVVRFRQTLRQIRRLTATPPDDFYAEVQSLCAAAGVAIVVVPAPSGAAVSGATRWLTPDKAMILLSLRYKRDDQFWFSLFHEAGHILLHSKRSLFIDEDKAASDTGDQEEEANAFAAEFLIPESAYQGFLATVNVGTLSKQQIQSFADAQGIAAGIVVGRLQHDGHLPYTHCNDLKRKLDWVGA